MHYELTRAAAARSGHPIRKTVRQAIAIERKRRDDGDAKLFLLSFAAFFTCFYSFIA